MAKPCNNAVQPPTGVVRFFKVKHDVTPTHGEKNPQQSIHQQCSNCKEYREIKTGFQKHHRNKANSICNDCTYAIECASCNQFKHRYVHYSVAQRALKSLGQSECHQCVAYKNALIEWETRRDQGVAPTELGPRPEPGGTEFDEMEASQWDQSLLEEITVSTEPESWSYSDDNDVDY